MRPLFLTLAPLLLLAACSGGSDKDGEDTATPAGDDDDDTTGDDDDTTTGDDDDDTTTGDDDDDDTTVGDDDDDDDTTTTDTGTDTPTSALEVYACDAKLHGLTTTVLDTSDEQAWVHYDLDTGMVVDDTDASWDLRFQTWFVETNGGVTGSGGVEVAWFEGFYDVFDDHCLAPSEGFAADTVSSEAFGSWYDYDFGTHELSPHDMIFMVKTTEGAYHRMIWDGYYENAGAVHSPGFRHGPVEPPTK